MAKKNVNYVEQKYFMDLIEQATRQTEGFRVTHQAGFIKIETPNKYRLYVANTKNVGRVDLAGFEPPLDQSTGKVKAGFVRLGPGEEFGAVKAQIDFTCDPDTILNAFAEAIVHALTLPDYVAPKKQPPMASAPKSLPSPESAAQRLAKIKEVAEEMKVPVSQKVLEAAGEEAAE